MNAGNRSEKQRTREADNLGQSDTVERGGQSLNLECVGSNSPSEAGVVQNGSGVGSELSLINNGQDSRGGQVGNTGVGGRTDGRQRNVGNVVTLPVDGNTIGERDECVESYK